MSIQNKDSKIIIIGAGVMGLSTTLTLLEAGYTDIHLFDKRDYLAKKYNYFEGCDSASSDMNKIFRSSYGEEVHYQQMSYWSREKFIQWNKEIATENWEGGEPIYFNTGNVHLTDNHELPDFEKLTLQNMPDEAICVSAKNAAEKAVDAGLDACSVDPFQMSARGKHLQGVLDTTGGMTLADKSCRWVLEKCRRIGGEKLKCYFGATAGTFSELLLQYNASTNGKKCIGIKTKDGKLHFAPLVVSASGAWNTEIVPETAEKLEATGGSVVMMKITDPVALKKYDQKIFPTWTYKVRDGAIGGLYGFPVTNGVMKIGYRGLKWTNPQNGLNSKVKTKWSDDETETNIPLFALKQIKKFVKENIPEVSKITMTRLCWYSDSEDNDYLLSYCPYYEDNSLFVMGGDSGHAFMMLGSIGDVAYKIMNGTSDPLFEDLFSWKREREKKNLINAGPDDARCLSGLTMSSTKDWWIKDQSKL
ncbi:hypothetical protein DAMA08_021510 [Martiniozyma asiatica (nom. inval.)]|nr:hypothetical protein DAMA08_021510 [Martiniozyma asiatica]